MTRPTREEAARTLGLPVSSDQPAVKRAYRRLAREHHPDLGGDPDTFQQLHRAYERLLADDAPAGQVIARGRPSRPAPPADERTEVIDTSTIRWDRTVPRDGTTRLDADLVAVWLASDVAAPGEPGPEVLADLTATSRAPGSRLNRVAHLLAAELTARLHVHERTDDRGRPVIGIEVAAGSRRARRALDTVPLDGGWVRTRTSSTTRLRASLRPSGDRRTTAVRVTRRLEALLEELGWPFTTWTLEQPATPVGARTS